MDWTVGFPPIHCHESKYIETDPSNVQYTNVARIQTHQDSIIRVEFSPDGRQLVSVGADGYVCLYDLQKECCVVKTQCGLGAINDCCWGPLGRHLYLATQCGVCLCLSVAHMTNQTSSKYNNKVRGQIGSVRHNDNMREIYTNSEMSKNIQSTLSKNHSNNSTEPFQRCNTYLGVPVQPYPLEDIATSISSPKTYGQYFLTGGYNEMLRKWDIRRFQCITDVQAHTGPLTSIESSNDDQLLLTTSLDGYLRLWDPCTLDPLISYDIPRRTPFRTARFTFYAKAILGIPYGRNPEFCLWNVPQPKEIIYLRNDKSYSNTTVSTDLSTSSTEDLSLAAQTTPQNTPERNHLTKQLFETSYLDLDSEILAQAKRMSELETLFLPNTYGIPTFVQHYAFIPHTCVDIWDLVQCKITGRLNHYKQPIQHASVTSVTQSQASRVSFIDHTLIATSGSLPDCSVKIWCPCSEDISQNNQYR